MKVDWVNLAVFTLATVVVVTFWGTVIALVMWWVS